MSDETRQELLTKTLRQIQLETANKWADRACEAYALARRTNPEDPTWLHDAYEYEHEAIEHAAGVDNDAFLASIRTMIHQAKKK